MGKMSGADRSKLTIIPLSRPSASLTHVHHFAKPKNPSLGFCSLETVCNFVPSASVAQKMETRAVKVSSKFAFFGPFPAPKNPRTPPIHNGIDG